MYKVIYSLVVISSVLFSCSDSDIFNDTDKLQIDEVDVTVTTTLPNRANTRLGVSQGDDASGDWQVYWEEDDILTLVNIEDSSIIDTLKIKSIDTEANIATFTGSVKVGTYDIYIIDNYSIEDGTIIVDYTLQSDSCHNMPMVSPNRLEIRDEEDNYFDGIVFEHIAQAIDLRMSFTNMKEGVTYNLVKVEVIGGSVFDGVATVTTDKDISTSNSEANIYCYLPEFTIDSNESVTVNCYFTDGGCYSLSCVKVNSGSDAISFVKGTYNYLNLAFDFAGLKEEEKWTDNISDDFGGVSYSTNTKNYTISTPEEFAYLVHLVAEGKTMYGTTFTLAGDIDLAGKEWTPIGSSSSRYFGGTFDGNGKTISGLYVDDSSIKFTGLFGYVKGATIKNLTVTGEVKTTYIEGRVGGITAFASQAIITNCCSKVDISGGEGARIGGVAGFANTSSTISDCNSGGDISGIKDSYVGGLVGCADDSSIVINSYNSGEIYSEDYTYVGGIAGYVKNAASVINCYNSMGVVCKSHYAIGGIVGSLGANSVIRNCYNRGLVIGGTVDISTTGGLIGRNLGVVSDNYWACDIPLTTESGVGNDSDNMEVIAMGLDKMKDKDFVDKLNSYVEDYNNTNPTIKASSWVIGYEGFPTFG